MTFRWLAALPVLLVAAGISAEEASLNPSHPSKYTVVQGDTLWDIAARFLRNPWEWPTVWQRNPQIQNPDLIYPGDVLELSRYGGETKIRIAEPSEIRLSPRARVEPTRAAIPTIRMDAIRPFLSQPRVLSERERDAAPYIAGLADGRILGGEGDLVYVRAIPAATSRSFTLFRPGQVYKDGETGEILGYEALYVADAELQSPGDPATLVLLRNEREASVGDRVLPLQWEKTGFFVHPHVTPRPVRGHIISVLDGVSQIGQYEVVAVDRGARDGIEIGHVFDIFQKGTEIRDLYGRLGSQVVSPEQRAGSLMVFRVFHRVSYALVLEATRTVHVLDVIQTP